MANKDDVIVTGTQLVDVMRELIKSQQGSNTELAELMSKAVSEATMKTRQWWNEEEYPEKSVFNPQGEKDHPRPKFAKEVYWLGYRCQESQHTAAEIELLNQLVPGKFHLTNAQGQVERYNFFTVREREPGVPNGPLMVEFPWKDPNDRMMLARFDQGRGMVDILQQLVQPVVVPA